jgi:hypothetical protein
MLKTANVAVAGALGLALAGLPIGGAGAAGVVTHQVRKILGLSVDTYAWTDSKGLKRTVSLKRQGGGNPDNGGYAVQMTYEVVAGGQKRQVVVNAAANGGGDGGFGYFVSHERYRRFTDNSEGTIAQKVFGADDSPLGKRFPVKTSIVKGAGGRSYAHKVTLTYPRYGTVAPIPKDANGEDVAPTPTDKAKLALYGLVVTITWVFEDGKDHPRIDVVVDMSDVPGPDRVNFDVRGPYGVMIFDDRRDGVVAEAIWGDRYHFDMTKTPATRNSSWTWNTANAGARYTALVAGGYEMGLYEPRLYKASALRDGYSEARGRTSATYNNGNGCPFQDQLIPCDYEWPYQSLQYSLPYDDPNAPTTGKKIAWGSAPYYGTGPSLTVLYDTPDTSRDFVGWPASKKIAYSVCLVVGRTVPGGLTRAAAAGAPKRCAAAKPGA